MTDVKRGSRQTYNRPLGGKQLSGFGPEEIEEITMKKNTIRFFRLTAELALLCAVLSVCAGSPAPVSAQTGSRPDELDVAIREASTYLNGKVPKSSKVVFLNIKSDYPDLSEYILSVLSENAVNDGVFSVVDRQQLDSIRVELNFQMSGEVSDKSAQSIGQMLGAQIIVSGAVNKIGTLYRIQVKAIEVQTAGVRGQWSRNVPAGATMAALTERYAPAGTAVSPAPAVPAQIPAAPVTTPVPVPAPATPMTYKIGDKGPAGGSIFYDKGVVTNGWRYLEAAPNDIGPAQWGIFGTNVNGLSTSVGAGRTNTQRIVSVLSQAGDDGAALLCSALTINGHSDWFLPSKDELDLMYKNLRQKGLGGFGNGWYWSSSQSNGYPNNDAWIQNFSDGTQADASFGNRPSEKNRANSIRAIRQF